VVVDAHREEHAKVRRDLAAVPVLRALTPRQLDHVSMCFEKSQYVSWILAICICRLHRLITAVSAASPLSRLSLSLSLSMYT
jgi:hypothetical protein